MIKYDWCGQSKDWWITVDFCLNWMCECGHTGDTHFKGLLSIDDRCSRCKCNSFKYLNNNNCTIECSFYRKLMEVN